MANRHLSRSIVLQTLFEWDFANQERKHHDDLNTILDRNVEEFASGSDDRSYMDTLLENIIKRTKDLDTIIEKAAPDWPIDKISAIDRNILRLGLYELLFADRAEVPPKVAINEAIELAKTYGGESSSKFVNGVLGSVYKEIGEPDKDQKSHRQKFEVAYEDMPIEKYSGAVVYTKEGDDVYLALVHDVFGHWTLSKGHVEEGETVASSIVRGIKEEIGLDVEVEEEVGTNEYVASHPEKGKLRKQVSYHIARAPFHDLTLKTSGGLDDARWFKLAEIVNLNMYDDILPIVTKAINLLLKK